jgi:hypothetical protein
MRAATTRPATTTARGATQRPARRGRTLPPPPCLACRRQRLLRSRPYSGRGGTPRGNSLALGGRGGVSASALACATADSWAVAFMLMLAGGSVLTGLPVAAFVVAVSGVVSQFTHRESTRRSGVCVCVCVPFRCCVSLESVSVIVSVSIRACVPVGNGVRACPSHS